MKGYKKRGEKLKGKEQKERKKERFCKLRMETAYKKKMEGVKYCMKQLVGVLPLDLRTKRAPASRSFSW